MRLSFTFVLWVFTLCAQTTCACNNCYLIQVEDSPVALQWVWFVYVDTCTDNAHTARFVEATVKSHWQHPQSLQNTTCYRLKGSNLSLSFFICIHTTQCMLSFSFCVCVCALCVSDNCSEKLLKAGDETPTGSVTKHGARRAEPGHTRLLLLTLTLCVCVCDCI